MAVGTILAAFGTALPESVVTLVAVTTGPTDEAKNIGGSAAMGGPLASATVAYGVTGGAMRLLKRRKARALVLVGAGMPDAAGVQAPGLTPAPRVVNPGSTREEFLSWTLPILAIACYQVVASFPAQGGSVRRTKSLSALATLILAMVFSLALSGPAHAAGPAYVALGDSYSSGNGAGNYDSASGNCHRSFSAYPYLWKNTHAPSSFADTSCSGAATTDVTNSQLSPLNSSTGLVSITIGGNDAGFSDVITTCVTGSDSDCVNRVNQAESYAQNTLPARLDATYNAIRAKAPNAKVVVLGYPHVYTLNVFCVGLSDTKHRKIDEASDVLDSVIANRASAHGFVFGDVRTTFKGHELCSGDNWLHSLVVSPSWESYHPTATGHTSGYYPVLNANS